MFRSPTTIEIDTEDPDLMQAAQAAWDRQTETMPLGGGHYQVILIQFDHKTATPYSAGRLRMIVKLMEIIGYEPPLNRPLDGIEPPPVQILPPE